MIESEWLTSVSPDEMLRVIKDRVSDRKLRLVAVGCCRQIWNLLLYPRSRFAVEVIERHADAQASQTELRTAMEDARAAAYEAEVRSLAARVALA